jgi:glucose-1-phosphate thymidylyltransferase
LVEATEFVKTVEKRTGLKIGCLEEIALFQNWISKKQISDNITDMKGEYYDYVRQIIQK